MEQRRVSNSGPILHSQPAQRRNPTAPAAFYGMSNNGRPIMAVNNGMQAPANNSMQTLLSNTMQSPTLDVFPALERANKAATNMAKISVQIGQCDAEVNHYLDLSKRYGESLTSQSIADDAASKLAECEQARSQVVAESTAIKKEQADATLALANKLNSIDQRRARDDRHFSHAHSAGLETKLADAGAIIQSLCNQVNRLESDQKIMKNNIQVLIGRVQQSDQNVAALSAYISNGMNRLSGSMHELQHKSEWLNNKSIHLVKTFDSDNAVLQQRMTERDETFGRELETQGIKMQFLMRQLEEHVETCRTQSSGATSPNTDKSSQIEMRKLHQHVNDSLAAIGSELTSTSNYFAQKVSEAVSTVRENLASDIESSQSATQKHIEGLKAGQDYHTNIFLEVFDINNVHAGTWTALRQTVNGIEHRLQEAVSAAQLEGMESNYKERLNEIALLLTKILNHLGIIDGQDFEKELAASTRIPEDATNGISDPTRLVAEPHQRAVTPRTSISEAQRSPERLSNVKSARQRVSADQQTKTNFQQGIRTPPKRQSHMNNSNGRVQRADAFENDGPSSASTDEIARGRSRSLRSSDSDIPMIHRHANMRQDQVGSAPFSSSRPSSPRSANNSTGASNQQVEQARDVNDADLSTKSNDSEMEKLRQSQNDIEDDDPIISPQIRRAARQQQSSRFEVPAKKSKDVSNLSSESAASSVTPQHKLSIKKPRSAMIAKLAMKRKMHDSLRSVY